MTNLCIKTDIAVVGGGAAGYFGAINAAESFGDLKVTLLEKSLKPLAKVAISGGGRCNVTHSCFDPKILIQNYPRGGQELLGPFHHFQPKDMIQWLEERGVILKTERDGRIFPTTDSSQTIIHCLQSQATSLGVDLITRCSIKEFRRHPQGFILQAEDGRTITCRRLLLATGSAPSSWQWLETLGHHIEPPVPSLFGFCFDAPALAELSGTSMSEAIVSFPALKQSQKGAVLITHFGLSGPAVLRLSAFAARHLHECGYETELQVNWTPQFLNRDQLHQALLKHKTSHASKAVSTIPFPPFTRSLWLWILSSAGIDSSQTFAHLTKSQIEQLGVQMQASSFDLKGKSTHKEEFVTCGGVSLKQVDFKTMQSRLIEGLYFAGEVLDIDGVTGGFNFQSAWTTSWLAGRAIGKGLC